MRYILIAFISVLAFSSYPAGAYAATCTPACTTGFVCTDSMWGSASCTAVNTGGENAQPTNTNTSANNAQGGVLVNPLGENKSLNSLLSGLLNILVQIGVVVLTLMIVYCGFLFVTAQGNPENLSKAKSALLWTVIGGAVILGAEVIARAIETTVKAL